MRATFRQPTIFLWVVLMMFTASTEFAPGQWVDVALSQIVGMRGILLLAYVSGLMFVMRHFAGPLVKRLSNVGLLIFSAVFATVGLFALGAAHDPVSALIAATGWGFGVCLFLAHHAGDGRRTLSAQRHHGVRPDGLGGRRLDLCGAAHSGRRSMTAPSWRRRAAIATLAAHAQGAQLTKILTAAAAASFRAVALIPLALIFIFAGIAIADRLRKGSSRSLASPRPNEQGE